MTKKCYFFWGGPFSNWATSFFTVGGFEYNCGEQFFMHQKAITFKDYDTAGKILREGDPREQKALGRTIKGFVPEVWDNVKYEIVKHGLRQKFLQNEDLKEFLISHKSDYIVEASPEDRIWGIGYFEKDALKNRDNWGENLLGKILTELALEISGDMIIVKDIKWFKVVDNIYICGEDPHKILYKDDRNNEMELSFEFIKGLRDMVGYLEDNDGKETPSLEGWKKWAKENYEKEKKNGK